MGNYFEYLDIEKPGCTSSYASAEEGNKKFAFGIFEYWQQSHLGSGYGFLLKPGERMLSDRITY